MALRVRQPLRSAETLSCHGASGRSILGQSRRRPNRPRLIHRRNAGAARQAQVVAPDLDVALLQHVEQRDLDALGQVGQLV
ncbi:hypothetical protein ABZ260_49440, partial [Streptosporangium sp. NPDC006013]|uniref:hypothetical protein n=1 Tax=Streptosporangium sp. NPDC006013 TaxID=3155596 RepID=UPI0033B0808F